MLNKVEYKFRPDVDEPKNRVVYYFLLVCFQYSVSLLIKTNRAKLEKFWVFMLNSGGLISRNDK